MVRKPVGMCALLVAIGLAWQPVQAGDRRSSRRGEEASEDIFVQSKTQSLALKYEVAGVAARKNFEAGSSATVRRRSSRDTGTPATDSPGREHRRLTLFHINSRFGDIAVEPVIGRVNGAQFSIGF